MTVADEYDEDTYLDCEPRPLRQRLVDRARRVRVHVRTLRSEWRDAGAVGAVIFAPRNVVDDAPRLQGMIEHDLMRRLDEATTLRWSADDTRHAARNMVRRLRGRPAVPYPWRYEVSVEMSATGGSLIERNMVAIRAERQRRPRVDVVRSAVQS